MLKWIDKEPIPESLIRGYHRAISPMVRLFMRLKLHPNTFTTLGLLVSMVSGYMAARGFIRASSALLLISGMFDTIDGKLARDSGKVSKFGALFDSTLDRYAEVIYFFGLAYFFIRENMHLVSLITAIALGGSLMVSYIRARAEGLGFTCKVGILQRPERLLLVGVAGLIHVSVLVVAIWIVAILSNVTAVVRIVHVWHQDQRG